MKKENQEPIIGQELAYFIADVWNERDFQDSLEDYIDY